MVATEPGSDCANALTTASAVVAFPDLMIADRNGRSPGLTCWVCQFPTEYRSGAVEEVEESGTVRVIPPNVPDCGGAGWVMPPPRSGRTGTGSASRRRPGTSGRFRR